MHLEVAAVDDVVAGDHQLGELHVLMLDGLDGLLELRSDEVEAVQRPLLEVRQLLLVLNPDAVGISPPSR